VKRVVETVEDATILLSIHDITPFHEDDIVQTYDLLCDLGISSFTLLATPFYALKKSNSFSKGSLFSEFLLSLDLEIALHGYSHFTKSGAMNEFSSLSTKKTMSRLKDGISLIQRSFAQKPSGFVPPMWESPPRVIKAVKDLGLVYSVEGDSIHHCSDSKVFSTAGRIIGQGQRILNTEAAIFEIELGGSLQIAIHPSDYRTNDLFDLLTDLKDRQNYRFLGYRDYLLEKK